MPGPRLQRLVAKIGLPVIALLAAAGLSTAVAATYLTFTADSSVGSFSPEGVPVELLDATTTTTTSTTLVAETTTTTAVSVPAVTPTTAGARPRTPTTTVQSTTRATSAPARATTTTTECSNSGKGNCRSRGGKPDDD